MPRYTLTVLDVTGIQSYIFGSNRLRENIGASQLVELATHEWVQETLSGSHNLDTTGKMLPNWRLEDDDTRNAEVILRGGGNVLVLFRTLAMAKETVGKLSRKLLEQAPGLEIAVAHREFEWEDAAIGGTDGIHSQLMAKLNRTKQQRSISTPLLGQAVTLECRATGLPAVGFDPARRRGEALYPLSADVLAKLDQGVRDSARERFEDLLPPEAKEPYFTLSADFDDLGRSEGDTSYIAVVHADGNNMGKRFQELAKGFLLPKDNRTYLEQLRRLSEAVERAGQTALYQTLERMNDGFKLPGMKLFLSGLKRDKDEPPFLPFRPIVFGGDDVTFVCDGRIGLSLAAIYLDEWEKATAADETIGKAYACAGIAIVKTHYPFARAYALCEDLCKSTKAAIKAQQRDASALDWHFALTGITGTINEIRKREYQLNIGSTTKPKSLVMRPVTLRSPGIEENWCTWETFTRLVEYFESDEFAGRNKVKDLREVLRSGPEATRRFLHTYGLSDKMPLIDASKPQLQASGWDNRCGYFDAIEAIDFYLPLT